MNPSVIASDQAEPLTQAVVLFPDEREQVSVNEEKMASAPCVLAMNGGEATWMGAKGMDFSSSVGIFVEEEDHEVESQRQSFIPEVDREVKMSARSGLLGNERGFHRVMKAREQEAPQETERGNAAPWAEAGVLESMGLGELLAKKPAQDKRAPPGRGWGMTPSGRFVPRVTVPEPKPYNYEVERPEVVTSVSLGETNIRKIDVDALNRVMKQQGDNFDQYWTQVDKKKFLDEILNFNEATSVPDAKPPAIPSGSGGKSLLISGLQTKITDQEALEEPGIDNPDSGPLPPADRGAKTIDQTRMVNSLDDVQQLTKDSVKLQQAFRAAGSGKWSDGLFPANVSSIVGFGESAGIPRDVSSRFDWRRPEKFIQGFDVVVYDQIEPTDIAQGGLGDCYLLAACASIAEFGPRIERIFLSKKYEPRGIYAVALCLDGIWEEVVMDDQIPCVRSTGKVAFNNTRNGELWVILLEKAWAKAHGGYFNIAAGLSREALRDLTGASAKTFFTQENREDLWLRILEANRLNFIMTAGTDDLNNGSDAYIEKIGICGGHAYSLLDAQEVISENGKFRVLEPDESAGDLPVERIVKLRNPWGSGEWKGSWSDNAPEWNEPLRKRLNYYSSDDGIFYMSWNDFLKYFSDMQICYFHDNYRYSALKLQSQRNEVLYLKINVSQPGLYYFSLNQKNRRKFSKAKNYKYSNLSFVVGFANSAEQTIDYVGAGMKPDKENWISAELVPGNYFVRILTPWQSVVNEFAFSLYGPGRVGVSRVQSESLPADFLMKLFKSHAYRDTSAKMYSFSGQGLSEVKYKQWDNQEGYGYIYFINEGSTNTVDVTIELLGSKNIQLLPPFSGLRPQVSVEPKKSALVAYQGLSAPYSVQARFLATLRVPETEDTFKALARASKTKVTKKLNGQPLDIFLMVHVDPSVMLLLYENKTAKYVLAEKVQFELQNARIDGVYGAHVEVSVKPGREQLVRVLRVDEAQDFSAKIKNLSYEILKA